MKPLLGSLDAGLDFSACFDAKSRYRPYGFADDEEEASEPISSMWGTVDWGSLQRTCLASNAARYAHVDVANSSSSVVFRQPSDDDFDNADSALHFPQDKSRAVKSREKRTAIVYQVYDWTEWTVDALQYLRSLVMEMNLHTGGEYELVVLVAVADTNEAIFEFSEVYAQVMDGSVPKEFRNASMLFNTDLLKAWYPGATQ